MDDQQNIIIYRTADGRASVALYAKDGKRKAGPKIPSCIDIQVECRTLSQHIAEAIGYRNLDRVDCAERKL
jgi:hypothetical protein